MAEPSTPPSSADRSPADRSPGKRSPRAIVLGVLKVAITLGLLVWLGRSIVTREGVDALWESATGIDPLFVGLAVLAHFVAVLSGISRWSVLLRGRGIRLPFTTLARSFLIGRFLGAFTPSTTGLDGYRLYDVSKRTGDLAGSTAVIAIEKLVGLIGMATVCLCLLPFGLSERLGWTAVAVALGMAGIALLGLFVLASPSRARALFRPLPKGLRGRAEKIADALSGSGLSMGTLAPALLLGIVSHLALSATFAASGFAVHAPVSAATLLSVGNAIVIAVLLPISIGGIGVREGAAVALLSGAGVATSDAVLLALLSYLTGQVPALLGGLVLLGQSAGEAPKKSLMPAGPADSPAA
jgi:glycosyltransferase 2 family protein